MPTVAAFGSGVALVLFNSTQRPLSYVQIKKLLVVFRRSQVASDTVKPSHNWWQQRNATYSAVCVFVLLSVSPVSVATCKAPSVARLPFKQCYFASFCNLFASETGAEF